MKCGRSAEFNSVGKRTSRSPVTDLSTGTDPHRHTPGTHNHTQTPAEQGRRGQARQTHEVFRTRPTRRASKRARPTTNQPVLQPASPAPPARPESRPNPNPMRPFSSPAGRPQSRSSARPRKGGRPPGARATPTHTAHSPTHTHTHFFTHSPRRGEMKGGAGRSQRPVALREHPGSSQAVPLSVAHRVGAPPP